LRSFRITTRIDAPADRVWQVMVDAERWHEWTPSVTRIKLLDHRPLAVGSVAVIRQPRFPPARWKVTAIESGRSFTWVSIGPGVRVVAHHSVEPAGPSSEATLSFEYRGVFGGLLGRLTASITERYLALEAHGLKARSEDPDFHHAGSRRSTGSPN